MEVIAKALVPRHCVSVGVDGLSRMQSLVMNQTAPFSCAIALTGAGKSYVYIRLVAVNRERILFIVPTRRLAQNLRRSALEELVRSCGISEEQALRMVHVFTSDSTASMRQERPGIDMGAYRRSVMLGTGFSDHGEIIFATPEAVSWLLLNPSVMNGHGDVGIATLMASFDRIVFDEGHLIQERGFGLMGLLARVSQEGIWTSTRTRRSAMVSMLSATPLDVGPIMRRLGVNFGEEDIFRETLSVSGGRALHGDVTVEFVQAGSCADIVEEMAGDIGSLASGYTCAVIYDSLRDMQQDAPRLRELAVKLGIPASHTREDGFFMDSSLDGQMDTPFSGRFKEIGLRRLLVATSTIEVGVTLPSMRLLIMDPGINMLSHMQRFGRNARGDFQGRIIVCISPAKLARNPWLQALVNYVRSSGGTIPIDELVAFAAKQSRLAQRFQDAGDDVGGQASNPDFYGAMSTRAVYSTGVYWHLLDKAMRNGGGGHQRQASQLHDCAPQAVPVVRSWLARAQAGQDSRGWLRSFLWEARTLRNFPATVIVMDAAGCKNTVSEAWLARNTHVLERYPVVGNERGMPIIKVDDICWPELVRDKGEFGDYKRLALLPFQGLLGVGNSPINQFRDEVTKGLVSKPAKAASAVKAALDLVCCTGILPYQDNVVDHAADTEII